MDDTAIAALVGVAATLLVAGLIASLRAGGLGRLGLGFAAARRASRDASFATMLSESLEGKRSVTPATPALKPATPAPPKPTGEGLRALALLQSEARLVDFLMEDIQAATDEQIGQTVREVHRKAREALLQHAKPEEILPGMEGDTVTVPAGFDPSRIRVVGNVVGHPPFTGTLQHPGWRVKDLKLATPPASADEHVLQPAEVHIA